MTDYSPRSYLRAADGPRVVETGNSRERSRYSRYSNETKSKRTVDRKQRSKHENSARQTSKPSTDRPTFRLDLMNQPPAGVLLGVEVGVSVLLSLVFPSTEAAQRNVKVDTNRLVAMVSLVAETNAGERIPMETDAMVAQKAVDSVRSIPGQYVERLAQAQPCRVPLGYFSFPDLLIRQSGYYRIRTALVQVPSAGTSPTTITTHDSELIRVERRAPAAHQRRQQR